jgi:ABC-type nickel/cobalt efflux system permease component RcnA
METNIVAALGLGFVLGLRHALDPDHLVAVTTMVSEHKSLSRSSLVGTFWGLGHTASLLAVGLVVIVMRNAIPEKFGPWLELPVAMMLIILGVNTVVRVMRDRGVQVHSHVHSHDGEAPHSHLHLHAGTEHDHRHRLLRLGRRPFLVGLVHGVAGSAAVTLAVLATIPSAVMGLAYIALFGIGSIGGMLLMSALIGLPFTMTARRFTTINGATRLLAGIFSIAFGVLLTWNIISDINH